jgi:hypothetical protein
MGSNAVESVDESGVHESFNVLQERIEIARGRIQSVKVDVERKRTGIGIEAQRAGDVEARSKPLRDPPGTALMKQLLAPEPNEKIALRNGRRVNAVQCPGRGPAALPDWTSPKIALPPSLRWR